MRSLSDPPHAARHVAGQWAVLSRLPAPTEGFDSRRTADLPVPVILDSERLMRRTR
jgi:hypothetical protein